MKAPKWESRIVRGGRIVADFGSRENAPKVRKTSMSETSLIRNDAAASGVLFCRMRNWCRSIRTRQACRWRFQSVEFGMSISP